MPTPPCRLLITFRLLVILFLFIGGLVFGDCLLICSCNLSLREDIEVIEKILAHLDAKAG